jgi:hypothetical protein
MVDLHKNLVPVTASISSSAATCSRSGYPPFTVTITYECTIGATVWVLYPLFTLYCEGVEIRDPTRRHRRVGPAPTQNCTDGDEDEFEDTELLHLEPGQIQQKMLTLASDRRANNWDHNDFRPLTVGNTYELTVHGQTWWWIFEDDLPENCTSEERLLILKRQPGTTWKPNCMTHFTLVS